MQAPNRASQEVETPQEVEPPQEVDTVAASETENIAPRPNVNFAPLAPNLVTRCSKQPSLFSTEVPLDGRDPQARNSPVPIALKQHTFLRGGVVTLFVPKADYGGYLESITALRFEVKTRQWLAPVTHTFAKRGLRAGALEVSARRDSYRLVSLDRWNSTGLIFRQGKFSKATAEELRGHSRRMYHDVILEHRPGPDPHTGAEVTLVSGGNSVRVVHGKKPLGDVELPKHPGVSVGVFSDSRRALLWRGFEDPMGYLVDIDSGLACSIDTAIGQVSMVFRTGAEILFLVHELTPLQRGGKCPPGRPCTAPRQPKFAGARLYVLSDSPQ